MAKTLNVNADEVISSSPSIHFSGVVKARQKNVNPNKIFSFAFRPLLEHKNKFRLTLKHSDTTSQDKPFDRTATCDQTSAFESMTRLLTSRHQADLRDDHSSGHVGSQFDSNPTID